MAEAEIGCSAGDGGGTNRAGAAEERAGKPAEGLLRLPHSFLRDRLRNPFPSLCASYGHNCHQCCGTEGRRGSGQKKEVKAVDPIKSPD